MNWLIKIAADIPVEQINNAIYKSIKLMVRGDIEWHNPQIMNTSIRPKLQKYYKINLKINNVQFSGDEFIIQVACYIFASPHTELIRDLYSPEAWDAWVSKNPLQPVTHIDSREGKFPQVKFLCFIRGKKPEHMRSPFEPEPQLGNGYHLVNSAYNLKTPYEVAEFVNTSIENFYKPGDGDGDGDDYDNTPDYDPNPSPQIMSPSPEPVLV